MRTDAAGLRRVVMMSAHHWSSPIHLSAHHLAKFLVRQGCEVAFLSTPTSILHRLRFGSHGPHAQRFADWRAGGGRDVGGRLFHYTPLALVPPSKLPVLRSRAFFDAWPSLTAPRILSVLGRSGFARPDLMIADTAVALPLWRALGRPRLAYRVTDHNATYPGAPDHLHASERELAQAAELVIYTGDALADYAQRLAPGRTIAIGNGVDLDHFTRPRPRPADYAGIDRPIALYVGTIARWFDWEAVALAAARNPGVEFVVIGPDEGSGRPESLPVNMRVLGPRPYADVPAFMQHAHVVLIPFRREGMEAFVDSINPLNLYEYFAAGLPVVASRFGQLVSLASPANLVDDGEGLADAVARLTSQTRDGDKEREFAARFGWDRQFTPLLGRLPGLALQPS